MTVRKKAEKFIEQGGSPKKESSDKEWKNICLRITTGLLENIQEYVEERVGMNRNAWILEAIQEKLEREK